MVMVRTRTKCQGARRRALCPPPPTTAFSGEEGLEEERKARHLKEEEDMLRRRWEKGNRKVQRGSGKAKERKRGAGGEP